MQRIITAVGARALRGRHTPSTTGQCREYDSTVRGMRATRVARDAHQPTAKSGRSDSMRGVKDPAPINGGARSKKLLAGEQKAHGR